MSKIITRFPPSPTGEIHIGNMRTMLFNYLFTKHTGGEIFLRFEDTDRERSKVEFEKAIIDGLHALGLHYNHGPFRQSERGELYKKKLQELMSLGHAYEAEESSDGTGQKIIRFKNPNKVVTFTDAIRGDISIDSSIFGDFVIARNIDNAIYHFAVVVDDIDMGITHVLRGEDHITSTPRQILLIEAFGAQIPTYGHLPMILGDDNKKLSKRHGAASVKDFLEQGYIPAALVNYLAFLGWNPGGEKEIYSLEELCKEFTLDKVGSSGARFDYNKLDDVNRHYMLKPSDDEYRAGVLKFLDATNKELFENNTVVAEKVIQEIIKPRLKKFSEVSDFVQKDELKYFFNKPQVDANLACFKDTSIEKTKETMIKVKDTLMGIHETDWTSIHIKNIVTTLAGGENLGTVLHPLRIVLSGKKQSPDGPTLAYVLGKEEVMERVESFLC